MGKKWIGVLGVLSILLLSVGMVGGRIWSTRAQSAYTPLMAEIERDYVTADIHYDAGTRTLRGTQNLHMTNRTGEEWREIVLRAGVDGQEDVQISGVTLNGVPCEITVDEDDLTVFHIACEKWEKGETQDLSFSILMKHSKVDGALVMTLPILAVWGEDGWRTDASDTLMDASYAEALDYDVVLETDRQDAVLFGGVQEIKKEKDIQIIRASMRGARDVSFAVLTSGVVKNKEIEGVAVRVLADSAKTAKRLMAGTESALKSLKKAGLSIPDALAVAQGQTARKEGAVYSGLIVTEATDATSTEQLRRRLTRLAVRQIFGIDVENDPWEAPWLSESLASAAEMLAYRKLKGENAYWSRYLDEMELASRLTRPHGVTVGASLARFGSDEEMTQVLRDEGGSMLLGLEEAVGEEAFVRALCVYVEQNQGKMGSLEALAQAFAEVTGNDWLGYLQDML